MSKRLLNCAYCILLFFFTFTGNSGTAQPVVTSMTIYTGSIGAAVGIRGTNFNTTAGNNIVYFGGARASISSATATNINVIVPVGATFQPVTVLNTATGLMCTSVRSFLPSFNSSAFVPGAIHFDNKVDFSTSASNAYGAVINDIDGDGKPDLVITNYASSSISVYRNTGTAGAVTSSSFSSPVTFTTGSNPAYLKIADLDGDGKPEIVVANSGSGTISVFRNTASSGTISSSSFATRVDFSAGSTPFDIAIADFDGDGKPDIAVTNSVSSANTISVLRNICSAGSIGSSSFSSAVTFATGSIPVKIVSADFDGDSKPDLAVTNNSSNSVSVYRNTASSGSITSSSFATKVDFTAGTNPRGIIAADLDNDGKFDLVVTNRTSNNISVLRNSATSGSISTSSFEAQDTFTAGTTPYDVAIGDLDGNGKPDIIITNFGATTVSVLRNIGSTGSITSSTFTAKKDFATGGTGGPYGLAIGDLDGDGKADIAVSNANSTGSVSVLRNNMLLPITNAGGLCTGSTRLLNDSISGGTWSSNATGVATISTTGMVTAVSAGMAIITYAVTGTYDTALITVGTVPTITITPVAAAICNGSSTTVTASGASTYSWLPITRLSATTGATVSCNTASTKNYTVTGTSAAGCTGTANQTITVIPSPFAGSISGVTLLCTGTNITLSDTAAGGSWSSSNTSAATVSNGIVHGLTAGNTIISYTVTNSCGSSSATSSITVNTIQWTGNVSSDWNDGSNWTCGFVPGQSNDATIPSGTSYSPSIAAFASGTVRDLNVTAGAKLTINNGASLNLKGNLTNNGTVDGSGALSMNNSNAQTISGIGFVHYFDVNNNAGVSVVAGARLTVKNVLSVTKGAFATHDSVVLYSDSTNTARVASLPTGASITGNVKVNQYITGDRRAYRFWAHPFSSYIPLSQLLNSIDISGPGGSANGFTTTGSNAPSSYRYDTYNGNSSLSYDIGWKPFTSALANADSNEFKQYQGIRLFYRGAKGEGLGLNSYTPSSTVIGQWGPLNQGDQNISLHRGYSVLQDYNMVGNPYASPVDIGTVIFNAARAGHINGAYFYIWNPFIGHAGAFMAVPYATGGSSSVAIPYYLQANNCFQVRTTTDGAQLNFTEANKSATFSNAYSLMRACPEFLSLYVYDLNYHIYDMLYLDFDTAATNLEDQKYDGGKPAGAAFNFYSLSSDNHRLMVDARPFKPESIIPLGLNSSYAQSFVLRVENMKVPEGTAVYLNDKLLNQNTLLQQGVEYKFTVSEDAKTQGDNRFELKMTADEISGTQPDKEAQVSITPNPATNLVTINYRFGKKEKITLRVIDISGTCVYNADLGSKESGKVTVALGSFASGTYVVELTSGSKTVVQKLVKE